MKRHLSLFAGIAFLFSITASAQITPNRQPAGPNTTSRMTSLEEGLARYLEMDDDEDEKKLAPSRPRIVKTSAVSPSVVINNIAFSRSVFDLINQMRARHGLAPLAWNEDLARVASMHSNNMAEHNFFSHKGLDSKLVSDRADSQGVGRWRAIGENIAFNRGYADPAAKTVELWLDSPAHKRNLLSPDWRESAIGVAINEDGAYYFTQVFLVRK